MLRPPALVCLLLLLMPFPGRGQSDARRISVPEGKIRFTLDSQVWTLAKKEKAGTMIYYNFKRRPIRDSLNRDVVANFSILAEPPPVKGQKLGDYAGQRRKESGYTVIRSDRGRKKSPDREYLIHHGRYTDSKENVHRILVWYGFRNGMALQLIFDTTATVWSECEIEFQTILESIRNET
jgi:hypothetical protein